jgi:hypothetical protein
MFKTSSPDDPPPPYPGQNAFPPSSYQDIRVFSISLNFLDRLRLIGAPIELVPQIRQIILSQWGKIQNEKDYYGALEFKLQGYPWANYDRDSQSVRSRQLMHGLLTCLISNGWNLLQGADISKSDGDKDVLFFENAPPDPEVQLIVMSLNLYDRIRLVYAPPDMKGVLQDAVTAGWPKGIQKVKEDYYGAFEIKMHGNPWIRANLGSESISRCILLSQIIANFKAKGYKLYASLDMTGGSGETDQDVETWVFRKIGPFYQ